MKWIKSLDRFMISERLNVSRDISQIIYELAKEKDKVANFLSLVIFSDLYDDDEDLNNLDISKELNKFSFVPKKMRGDIRFNQDSMPTRIGKVVNKIYAKCKKYFKIKLQSEIRVQCNFKENEAQITLPKQLKVIVPGSDYLDCFEKSKLSLSIVGVYDENGNLVKNKKLEKINLQITDTRYSYNSVNWNTIELDNIGYLPGSRICVDIDSKLERYHTKNLLCNLEIESSIELIDSDIESFVNKVVAYQKMNRADESAVIEEVKGEEIRYWYHRDNYLSEKGELGNSCMSYARCQPYLNLYCKNSDKVSLLILKNKENKLVGRALKWRLDDGKYLVDRCYTILNSDTNIFVAYARKNGYYYIRDHQFYLDNQKLDISPEVTLKYYEFSKYPYLDTLQNLDMDSGIISYDGINRYDTRVLTSTTGGYELAYNDDDDYDEDDDD